MKVRFADGREVRYGLCRTVSGNVLHACDVDASEGSYQVRKTACGRNRDHAFEPGDPSYLVDVSQIDCGLCRRALAKGVEVEDDGTSRPSFWTPASRRRVDPFRLAVCAFVLSVVALVIAIANAIW